MRDDHLGVCEFEIANREFLYASAIYSFYEATCAACTIAGERSHARSRFHRHLRVDERVCRARVHDESGRVSIYRTFNIEVIIRIQPHRDSSKAASDQKIRETLAHYRAGAIRADVKHLPRAIDDHPKLNHLARSEHTVEMRH